MIIIVMWMVRRRWVGRRVSVRVTLVIHARWTSNKVEARENFRLPKLVFRSLFISILTLFELLVRLEWVSLCVSPSFPSFCPVKKCSSSAQPCINHSCIMLCSPYDLILKLKHSGHTSKPWNEEGSVGWLDCPGKGFVDRAANGHRS